MHCVSINVICARWWPIKALDVWNAFKKWFGNDAFTNSFASTTTTFLLFPRSCLTTTQMLIQPWYISWAGRIEKLRRERLKCNRTGWVMRVQKDLHHMTVALFFFFCLVYVSEWAKRRQSSHTWAQTLRHWKELSKVAARCVLRDETVVVKVIKFAKFYLTDLEKTLIYNLVFH